jgi:AcrR family transcriptional regulator
MALQAARQQLIDGGPQSVTLKAVAGRIGRTHANLLHHFGSAAGLQKALAVYLAQIVCESVAQAFRAARIGEGTPREVVDLTFDAFDAEGGGALVMWMLATGHEDALDPVMDFIRTLLDELAEEYAGEAGDARALHNVALPIVLMALGDGLIGGMLANRLEVQRGDSRAVAEKMLIEALARQMGMASD